MTALALCVEGARPFGYGLTAVTKTEPGWPMADGMLDTSGFVCPIPILNAKRALSDMAAGATLEVLATNLRRPRTFLRSARRRAIA